ncbi:hypothetical protein L6452_34785 [Arctium lappa]|uniref:Uncharacterized protein n=1 Tax=Arctium lappa TaxID=4217 RepID=A0ACB8YIH9_ARCLA|nr:hypothetical protein L6452_34785 [Arctium lappa]
MPPFIHLFILLLSSIFTLTCASSSSPTKNLTLLGSAHFKNNSIILTQQLTTCNSHQNSATGRVVHSYPIRFLRSSSNATVSFSTRFSATIIPSPPPCLPGEGIAFLIVSDPNSLPHSDGYLGLPDSPPFFAIEFDTTFNPALGDINDNHVGVDVDSIISVASIDLMSKGIDLKTGKRITAWIEYRDSEKIIRVWVHYTDTKPENSILAVPVDLSKILKEFMFQGNRMPKKLKLTEIKSATKGFDQNRIIGEGASSIVYEANLPSCGNVAVKRFSKVNQSSSLAAADDEGGGTDATRAGGAGFAGEEASGDDSVGEVDGDDGEDLCGGC